MIQGVKAAGRDVKHPPRAEVKEQNSCTSTPLSTFMSGYTVNLTLTLPDSLPGGYFPVGFSAILYAFTFSPFRGLYLSNFEPLKLTIP